MPTIREYELMLSSVSHEIRNPVTLINSYLQLLAKDCPSVCTTSCWKAICGEMDHLIRLLQDLSAYQNGPRLHKTPLNLNLWLQDYANAAAPFIKEHGVRFTFQCTPALPVVWADADKLRQVLDNLVRNALEAFPDTGVLPNTVVECSNRTLSIEVCEQGTFMALYVRDNGCGIRPEDLDTLFDPFVTHKADGSGLGLALCRRIAEAHGGEISCLSRKDPTEFCLRLPAGNPR